MTLLTSRDPDRHGCGGKRKREKRGGARPCHAPDCPVHYGWAEHVRVHAEWHFRSLPELRNHSATAPDQEKRSGVALARAEGDATRSWVPGRRSPERWHFGRCPMKALSEPPGKA